VPSAVPPSFGECRARPDGSGVCPEGGRPTDRRHRYRRCPRRSLLVVRPVGARAPRREPRVRSGGSRVHSPSSPSRLAPAAGSLVRASDGYSSRSSPCLRDGCGSL